MMRAAVVALVAACASCHGWTGPRFGSTTSCRETARPGGAAGPVASPDADPAFAQLRAYRNYYAIAGVGAYEHHFAVWFSCVEQSVSYYAIGEDGAVRRAGGAWGGLAVRGDDVDEVPAEQRANAAKIAAQHDADYDGASAGRIEYLGSYREVQVSERVPGDGPGDPYARMMRHTTVTLRANAALTSFDGLAGLEGGETRICWKDLAYGDCGPQAWLAFTPARGAGEPQLAALVSTPSPQDAAERARFADVVLAAARAKVAGDPPVTIETLLAGDDPSMLPAGLAPPVVVGFTIYGRVTAGDQPSGVIRVELSPRALLAGAASGHGDVMVGGVGFGADVTLTVVGGVISDEDGVVEAEVRLDYTLDGKVGTATGRLEALVDDDAVVVTELAFPELARQELPGAGTVTQFDAYPGVSARREPWYPGS